MWCIIERPDCSVETIRHPARHYTNMYTFLDGLNLWRHRQCICIRTSIGITIYSYHTTHICSFTCFIIISWLTFAEYMCHKWQPRCSVYHDHNPVLYSFMAYHQVCSKNKMNGATYRGVHVLVGFVLLCFSFFDLRFLIIFFVSSSCSCIESTLSCRSLCLILYNNVCTCTCIYILQRCIIFCNWYW